MATIDILEKGGFLDNVNQVGDYLIKRFEDMMNRCKQIGDVRGKGLFIGRFWLEAVSVISSFTIAAMHVFAARFAV